MDPVMVDAHLDLAYNARVLGRDLSLSLDRLREVDPHPDTPLVTLESLREARVAVAFATLFVDPREGGQADWQEEVYAQLALYEAWEAKGWVRILREGGDLKAHLARYPQDLTLGLVLLDSPTCPTCAILHLSAELECETRLPIKPNAFGLGRSLRGLW